MNTRKPKGKIILNTEKAKKLQNSMCFVKMAWGAFAHFFTLYYQWKDNKKSWGFIRRLAASDRYQWPYVRFYKSTNKSPYSHFFAKKKQVVKQNNHVCRMNGILSVSIVCDDGSLFLCFGPFVYDICKCVLNFAFWKISSKWGWMCLQKLYWFIIVTATCECFTAFSLVSE